jgi:hypothetical protein
VGRASERPWGGETEEAEGGREPDVELVDGSLDELFWIASAGAAAAFEALRLPFTDPAEAVSRGLGSPFPLSESAACLEADPFLLEALVGLVVPAAAGRAVVVGAAFSTDEAGC